jgi:predicted neuraminidase
MRTDSSLPEPSVRLFPAKIPVEVGRAGSWALILLAMLLNGLPLLRTAGGAGSSPPGFVVPSARPAVSTTPVFLEEFINPDSPLLMSHVASVCELPNGRLAAAWYAGTREGARDVAICLATRDPGASGWSEPRTIMTREQATLDLNRRIKKVGNPVIFSDATGRLRLLFVSITVGGWSGSSLNLIESGDEGRSWSRSRRLTLSPFLNISELVKNGPAPRSDGSWAVPIYQELLGKLPELLWLRESAGAVDATRSRICGGRSGLQPALVPLSTNSALAFLRDVSQRKRISVARTDDAGLTWAPPRALDLPNPDSGLAALRLADGRVLLVFNDSTTGRENLRLAVSRDAGQTWTRLATLAATTVGEVSYPFVIQTRDGGIHVVYTWKRRAIKHIVFNEAWLDERQRSSFK